MTTVKTAKTIAAYDKNAEKYNAKFESFATYKDKIIAFQHRYIKRGAKILDLGCGPGNNITTIKSLDDSCQFTGIDLSESLLDIARKRHPSCTFINANISTLHALEQYDSILASFCIVHLSMEETEGLVRFIASSLRKGGSLYLSFMEGESSGFESTSFSDEEIFFHYYQVSVITTLLEDSHLQIERISSEDYLEQDGSTTADVFMYVVKN